MRLADAHYPVPRVAGESLPSTAAYDQRSADFAEQVWPPKDVAAIDLEKLRARFQLLACRPRDRRFRRPPMIGKAVWAAQKSDDRGRARPQRGAAQAASLA